MKRGMMTLLALLAMAALMSAGCASNEVVKAEEPVVAPAQTEAPAVEVTQPAAPVAPVEAPKAEETAKADSEAVAAAFEVAYFDFDKSDLRQDARDALSKNADIMLKTNTAANVKIEGHCDERGSAEYNMALGERRAKSALQYLLTLGVPSQRLSTVSYGEEKPAAQGSNEEAWAKNRRTEFIVVK